MDIRSIEELKLRIGTGYQITKEEALELCDAPLEVLSLAANQIRDQFCSKGFDICTIINGKSGKCSENCKYCAQSAHYCTNVEEYPLLDCDRILQAAQYNYERGIIRFSVVTSGKTLSDEEVEKLCNTYKALKETCPISICASHGLLSFKQFQRLKASGVVRYHNNLETSRKYFPNICTTHTYDDKLKTIRNAQQAGLEVCSGGIMGLGETMEDRVEMALELRALGVKSVPINILNPIKGTPLESVHQLSHNEIIRIVAIYRFILPSAALRLAGGRELMPDRGKACLLSGANAAISGDMLTTTGISINQDMELLKELKFEVRML